MFVVPTLLFVVPALLGHPAIDGDNLIQNFPLRVLAGQQIASGHLPLFNPLANSGTPLLGGLNAGALYPLTVIFAFVPAIAAWIINCVAVYVIAATGMFALLRWHGMRTLSSFAAAMSFAYSGAMIGQLVHLGVVQGFAYVPWAALILVSLSRRLSLEPTTTTWRHYARIAKPWVWGYALLWGLTFLTGEPRGIADIELLTLIVGPSVLLVRSSYWIQTWRGRVAYVVALAGGLAWGIAIGLVQLLPGWSFIGVSQRSSISYSFFGAGSLVVRWTSLLFIPDIFGGNGALGQPYYFAHYNLPEVTGYAGLLALIATFAFLAKVTRRGWKGEDRDYVLYFVILVVGLFATWGSYTPLGHVFRHIPLYGSTRLQSRNVILVDFAMSALLGWWFHRLQTHRIAEAGLEGRRKWITLAPALVVIALSAGLFVWGARIVSYLGVFPQQEDLARDMFLSYGLHLVIAAVSSTRAAALAIVEEPHEDRAGGTERRRTGLPDLQRDRTVRWQRSDRAVGRTRGGGPRYRRPHRAGRPGRCPPKPVPRARRAEHERLHEAGERTGLRLADLDELRQLDRYASPSRDRCLSTRRRDVRATSPRHPRSVLRAVDPQRDRAGPGGAELSSGTGDDDGLSLLRSDAERAVLDRPRTRWSSCGQWHGDGDVARRERAK